MLLDKLNEYCAGDFVPMHMPGHKRNTENFDMGNPYGIDITEIDGFDNLHHPEGILKAAMEKAAGWYGAEKTWYLVNGSSVGLMSAIMALTDRRDKVLVARNCHVSVYNAIYENELYPVYIYPENVDNLGISGKISPENVEKLLIVNNVDKYNNQNCGKIGAVIITSPTYEGNISDIRRIAEITHRYGVPLIVDEAHGAHFKYSDIFPKSALELGADVVVQSIHKTLPAFTQTALLHIGKGALEPEKYIQKTDRYVNMFQTTSPSYILMASIDRCLNLLNSEAGKAMMEDYVCRLKKLRADIDKLSCVKLAPSDDISKIVLYIENGSLQGKQLYDILLKQYGIQLEMASHRYVIAMTSVGDRQEYYDRFLAALSDIDAKLACDRKLSASCSTGSDASHSDGLSASCSDAAGADCIVGIPGMLCDNEIKFCPYDAVNADSEAVPYQECEGRISATTVCVYPPGIPIVCPGEIISSRVIAVIKDSLKMGLEVMGMQEPDNKSEREILCLR